MYCAWPNPWAVRSIAFCWSDANPQPLVPRKAWLALAIRSLRLSIRLLHYWKRWSAAFWQRTIRTLISVAFQRQEKLMSPQMSQKAENENSESVNKDTLFLLGGVALCVFGAGLVLTNPAVRRYLEQFGLGNVMQGSMPDIERYFRIRAM